MQATNRRRLGAAAIALCAAVMLTATAPAMASAPDHGPTLLTTPTPAATTNSLLSDVSCPTDDSCVAVGSAQTHGHHRTALVEAWNDTRWSVAAAGLFADLKPAWMDSVSCASAGHCVAVGYGTTANATGSHGQVTRPIALREVDGHWRRSHPVGQSGGVRVDDLSRLSCPDSSVCEAIGAGTEKGRNVTVIERLHTGRWTLSATSRLPGARRTAPGDIGCSAASACLVTESGSASRTSRDPIRSGLLRLTSTGWHKVTSALAGDLVATNVTCPPGRACLAFAHDARTSTLDELSDTGAFSSLATPVASSGRPVDIAGLTCPALDRCFGLGKAGAHTTGTASTAGTTVAETYDGTAYTLAFTGMPLHLDGLACRPSFCMLVGSHARTAATVRWEWPATSTDHNHRRRTTR